MDNQKILKSTNTNAEITKTEEGKNDFVSRQIDNTTVIQQNNNNEPVVKNEREEFRKIREYLNMQEQNGVSIPELAGSKEQMERLGKTENELKKLEQEEKALTELSAQYSVLHDSEKNSITNVKADIFEGYVKNQYGDIPKQIEKLQVQQSEKKQEISNLNQNLEDKLHKYEASGDTNRKERQEKVNKEFKDGAGQASSSKGKKKSGREKGKNLKVIGATEETYAMNYDMQHRQKMIDKWYKNAPKITNEDIELTGKEFERVFKNNSGSSMNIKAVMEKIAKLDIKANSGDISAEEKKKCENHRDLLKKTLRIVCAANGIDSETNTYFKNQDEETQKLVNYANSVYASAIKEFEDAVKKINAGEDAFSIPVTEEKKEESKAKEEPEKEQKLNNDKAIFEMHMQRIRSGKELEDSVWNAALSLCSSYDTSVYKDKRDPLLARKDAVEKETKFMSDVCSGDVKGIFMYVEEKIDQLNIKDILSDKFLDMDYISKNPKSAEELASIIQLINYAREKGAKTEEYKGLSDKLGYKKLVQFAALGDYPDLVKDAKAQNALSDRQKKVLIYRHNKMSNRLKTIDEKFEDKYGKNKEKESAVAFTEQMFDLALEEDMRTTLAKEEIEPMFNETVQELEETIKELEEKNEELKAENAIHLKEAEIGDALRTYIMCNQVITRLREKHQSVLGKTKKYNVSSQKDYSQDADTVKLVKELKEKMNNFQNEVEECEILKDFVKSGVLTQEQQTRLLNVNPSTKVVNIYLAYEKKKKEVDEKEKEIKDRQERIIKEAAQKNLYESCLLAKIKYIDAPEDTKDQFWQEYYQLFTEYENLQGKTIVDEKKEKEKLDKISEKEKEEIEKEFHTNQAQKQVFKAYMQAKVAYLDAKDENSKNETWSRYIGLFRHYKNMHGEEIDEKAEKEKLSNLTEEEKIDIYFSEYYTNKDAHQDEYEEQEKLNEESIECYNLQKELIATAKEELKNKYVKHYKDADSLYNDMNKKLDEMLDIGNYGQYNYVMSQFSENQMINFIRHNNEAVLDTAKNVEEMMSEAKGVLDKTDQLSKEELEKSEKLRNLLLIKEKALKGENISDELYKYLGNTKREKDLAKKKQAKSEKIANEIAATRNVLDEEKENCDYSPEAMRTAYKALSKVTKKSFEKFDRLGIGAKVTAMAKKSIFGEEQNSQNLNMLSEHYQSYMEQSRKLESEKKDTNSFSGGISYNTIGIQNFLLDISKDKYENIQKRIRERKKYKKGVTDYNLEIKDFKASMIKDGNPEKYGGFTSVDFEGLMYKREMLIEWLEKNKNLKSESFMKNNAKQQYDRREERLEKLNRFIKLYCESNGVDFESGQLLCEMKDVEDVQNKVMYASLLLEETLADIKESYFKGEVDNDGIGDEEDFYAEEKEEKKEEKNEKKGFIGKTIDGVNAAMNKVDEVVGAGDTKYKNQRKEKIGQEPEEEVEDSYYFTLVGKSIEKAALEGGKKKRTAHSVREMKVKVGALKSYYSVDGGIGKIKNEEEEKESYTAGIQAGAGFSYSALSAEFSAKYNRKVLGVELEAEGNAQIEVGRISAHGEVKAQLLDSNGKFSPSIHMAAGAELALLKIQASASAQIGGLIGAEAELALMVGLAATAKASLKDWKLSFGATVAVGVGFSLEFSLDFSGLKDKVADLAKKCGTPIGDYVLTRLWKWGYHGQTEKWREMINKDIDENAHQIISDADDGAIATS